MDYNCVAAQPLSRIRLKGIAGMTKQWMTTTIMLGALCALAGCSDFKQAIGSEKSVPDEFEVVVRPPLSLPPGFGDRPTADSVKEEVVVTTQSISAQGQASTLLETRTANIQGYDELFNFASVPDDIRAAVDAETAGIRFERRLPIDIVFGGLPNVGPILDQMAEDQRLRANRLQGRVPTDGGTPAIDEVLGEAVTVE